MFYVPDKSFVRNNDYTGFLAIQGHYPWQYNFFSRFTFSLKMQKKKKKKISFPLVTYINMYTENK